MGFERSFEFFQKHFPFKKTRFTTVRFKTQPIVRWDGLLFPVFYHVCRVLSCFVLKGKCFLKNPQRNVQTPPG